MKIIKVESCYYCPNADSCELYQFQPNPPDINCPLQYSDDWFKEELERRFPQNAVINDAINTRENTQHFIDWLKSELLKKGR